MTNRTIAILGATSHIAKGLIAEFISAGTSKLILFARMPERVREFLASIHRPDSAEVQNLREFASGSYDVVINCIGIGRPSQLQEDTVSIFRLTETYDNLVIDYLHDHSSCLFLNLSSGAVYGTSFAEPVDDSTVAAIDINHLKSEDWYGIAKLHAEAKHRALPNLRIIDLRVFAYFSRFIDLEARFLLADAITSIRQNRVLETGPENIVRDFLHPIDLHGLMMKCIDTSAHNNVFDACSREPITKFQALDYMAQQYGLKYNVTASARPLSVTGLKMNYYSTSTKSHSVGYIPRYTSLDCIRIETDAILTQAERNL
jgi:nucleoside-diphosphate-sugar epimerase